MVPETDWIIDSFAWIYWSDMAWIFGYVIQFTLGPVVYGWITLETFIQFWESLFDGSFGAFMMGPNRRMLTGWAIFTTNIMLTSIPGVNFVAPFFMYEWAKADYHDYYTKVVPMRAE